VVAFLSQDWLDLQRLAAAEGDLPADDLAEGGGHASAVIQTTVTGGPGGNVAYTTTIEHGRLVAAALGEAAGQPDLTFSLGYDDAAHLARGEAELGTLFMQGRLKAEGDMHKLFALLAADRRAAARAFVAQVADQTDF
jgi:hypothetical protein